MSNIEQMRKAFGNHERWMTEWKLGFDWGSHEAVVKRITPLLNKYIPYRVGSLLEIACGYGRATRILLPYCRQLYAIDLNQNCIDYCKSRPEFIFSEFSVCDGVSIPFDVPFNFVYSFDSLVHVDTQIIEAYVRQIGHLLVSGGVAILHHACAGDQGRGQRSNVTKQEVAAYVAAAKLTLVEQIDEQPIPGGGFNDTVTVMKKP